MRETNKRRIRANLERAQVLDEYKLFLFSCKRVKTRKLFFFLNKFVFSRLSLYNATTECILLVCIKRTQ